MIESREFNQPFCLSAIATCCLLVSLGSVVATTIMQVLNNQLSILGVQNASYNAGVVQIGSAVCTTNNNYNLMPLSYYKKKFTSHTSILSVTNVTTLITAICIAFSFSFMVVLLLNVKRKTNKCLTQVRSKQVVLGFLSLGLVSGTSTAGYLASFYLQINLLNCTASTNIATYRNTFLIPTLTSASGLLFLLVVYILVMFVKVDEAKHKYTAANKTTQYPTLEEDNYANALNMPMYKPSYLEQQPYQQQDGSDYQRPAREAVIPKKTSFSRPPKPEVNLQEVEAQVSKVNDQQIKESKMQGGILRARPKVPLQLLPNPKSYPKKQRPPFIPKKQLIRDEKQISLMKQVEHNSINKPAKETDGLVMNDSEIMGTKEQAELEADQDSHKQSDQSVMNLDPQQPVQEKKELEVPVGVLSYKQPSNTTIQQQLSMVDASSLYVFQRKMKVAHHTRLNERKTRQ